MPPAEGKLLIFQSIICLQRPRASISAQLVLTISLPKGPVTLAELQSRAAMALCMQLPPPILQGELANEVERAVLMKTRRASEPALLTPLQCLPLLPAKTQAGRFLHLLRCLSP